MRVAVEREQAPVLECARRRLESRGLHYTLDYPHPDESQRKDTVLKRG